MLKEIEINFIPMSIIGTFRYVRYMDIDQEWRENSLASGERQEGRENEQEIEQFLEKLDQVSTQ